MTTTGTPRRPASQDDENSPGVSRPRPSSQRKGRKPAKKRGFWHSVKVFFQTVIFLILVAAASAIVFVYVQISNAPKSIDLQFNPPGRTSILSADGVKLAGLFIENRQPVTIDHIPKALQEATVAFEDKRFYHHSGVDLQGIARAVWSNVSHHDMHGEGGSTLTQQLARNLGTDGLTREKSLKRKMHEWIVANQIERSYSKQGILEMYLNEVNYGAGAYGVQAAAQTYFGKDVKDLDLAQCALLAGLPNRPTDLNPYKHKKLAERQRNIVLDNMLDQGMITPVQAVAAKSEYVHLASGRPPKQGSQIFHAPYFVNYVIDQLKSKYGKDYLMQGNLKVYTTLNWPMQQIAEDTIKNGIDSKTTTGPNDACLVAIDPKTGEIKAMVGGMDYGKSKFNIATQARRQPGSLFKAITYSAAIDSGLVTEDTRVLDAPISYPDGAGGDWTPKDDDGYSYRRVDLRRALAMSINVPAVKVLKLLGPRNAIRYAQMMGIRSPLDPVLSLTLGSSAVTPLEMTSVYSTFPNGGNHVDPIGFTRVEDATGAVTEEIVPHVEAHVIRPDTNKELDDMLRAVVTEGTGTGANVVPDAHGKTGTTQGHKDVWFIGYTPSLVCGVWAGHPLHNAKTGVDSYGLTMPGNTWGATVCVPIWRNFMLKAEPLFKAAMAKEAALSNPKPIAAASASSDKPDSSTDNSDNTGRIHRRLSEHPAPTINVPDVVKNSDGTVTVNVDDTTGLLAPKDAKNSHKVTYADGSQPTTMSPLYSNPPSSRVNSARNTTGNTNPQPTAPASGVSGSASSPVNTEPTPSNSTPDTDSETINPAAPSTDTSTEPPPITIPSTPRAQLPQVPDTSTAPVRPRRRVFIPKPKPKPEYVTVEINPEDGLLATKWDPEVIEKAYIKGQQPRRYSHMYAPPPGEH